MDDGEFQRQMAMFEAECDWHFAESCRVLARERTPLRPGTAARRRLAELRARNRQTAQEFYRFMERHTA